MKLLLHTCCGPCMASFDGYFREKAIDYSAFFYNPNIHPYKEYLRRRDTFREYASSCGVEAIIEEGFMQARWEKEFKGMEGPERCRICYETRIGKTAEKAAELGFTHFTTTLLVSPYQNHELIMDICQAYAKRNNVGFHYHDFRKLFREGQQTAREAGLYRQKYCGCIYSYRESKFRDRISWD